MRKLDSQKFAGYLTYQVFMSPAFRDLTAGCAGHSNPKLYFEVDMSSRKRRRTVSSRQMVTNRARYQASI